MNNTPNANRLIEARITESQAQPLGQDGLMGMRDIVAKHQFKKINGVMVDAFSASAFVKVYDAVNARNQEKLLTIPMGKAIELALSMIK